MARRTKGEGTLLELPDGRWRARIRIDGHELTRDRTSRSEAVQALADLQEYSALGVVPRDWTVQAWLEHWIEHIDNRDASTRQGYRLLLKPAVYPAIGKLRLDRLQPEHIERLYKTMREGTHRKPKVRRDGSVETVKPMSESSILKVHRVLSRAMKVAKQRRQALRNPLEHVTPPKKQPSKVGSMRERDAQRVIEQAIRDGEGARWALSIVYGVRPGEALGLGWDMYESRKLRIRRQLQQLVGEPVTLKPMTKTQEGLRDLDVDDFLAELLAAHRKQQLEWMADAGEQWTTWTPPGAEEPKLMLFTDRYGHPIRPRQDATHWRRLLERAGVEYQRPYVGRHTAATMLIANGIDASTVAGVLGHSDSSFTMRTYVHPLEEKKRAATEMMGKLFRP
ncbi:Integrase [Gulosibacter sp. 10]|nr:Integrase [Gulosibacter sp. 10]